MEVNALHRKFKRKIQLLKTNKKIELQKIKEKIEPLRALGTLGLNESGGEEGLSPYDSFKEALFDGGGSCGLMAICLVLCFI
jgi:hypothetical protein